MQDTEAFRQKAIALLMQLERCSTLTQEEMTLKFQIQHHGATQIARDTSEISGDAEYVIHAATSA